VDLLAIGLGHKHLDGWDWLPAAAVSVVVRRSMSEGVRSNLALRYWSAVP
jgi:hypothetical protein